MTLDLATLNENQRIATDWQDGPLLVLAGPGSGKTRVIAYRIARLVAESQDERFRILGITFTNKAANEMRARVNQILKSGRERVLLTTFHSFAAEILRQHGGHVGLRPDFTILADQKDREAVLSDVMRQVDHPESFQAAPSQLLPIIDRLLDECVPTLEAKSRLGNQPNAETLASIYVSYRAHLLSTNQLDFSSLIATAVNLLDERPAIAKLLQNTYKYVCVDECQDTNKSQFQLLVRLVPQTNPNLFVVADDDQLIYQWNGASPNRLNELNEMFSISTIQLPENYRCPAEVVSMANSLISFNSGRLANRIPLTARKPTTESSVVSCNEFENFEEEAGWIASEFTRKSRNERQASIILSRRRKLFEDIAPAFREAGVPLHVVTRKNEFESATFQWIHSTLRLANAPQDFEQLSRVTRSFSALSGHLVDADLVKARAALDQMGYLRAWVDTLNDSIDVDLSVRKMIGTIKGQLAERLNYWAFVSDALDWAVPLEELHDQPIEDGPSIVRGELEIWTTLRNDIASHFDISGMSLHAFLQELDLRGKESTASPDDARCMTIAGSKGMEFKHVYLIGAVEDELPSFHAIKSGPDSDAMREERRNCFVAITRAEESLTVTFSRAYTFWKRRPSRFLREMGLIVETS